METEERPNPDDVEAAIRIVADIWEDTYMVVCQSDEATDALRQSVLQNKDPLSILYTPSGGASFDMQISLEIIKDAIELVTAALVLHRDRRQSGKEIDKDELAKFIKGPTKETLHDHDFNHRLSLALKKITKPKS